MHIIMLMRVLIQNPALILNHGDKNSLKIVAVVNAVLNKVAL